MGCGDSQRIHGNNMGNGMEGTELGLTEQYNSPALNSIRKSDMEFILNQETVYCWKNEQEKRRERSAGVRKVSFKKKSKKQQQNKYSKNWEGEKNYDWLTNAISSLEFLN